MSYLIQVESLLGLMLLAFVPLIWLGRKRLANAIGTLRAGAAVTIRSLLIVALCEPLWVVVNKQLSVLFVVDRSASISNEQLARATTLIAEQLQARKRQTSKDRVGVIGFGQAPAVELPVDSFGLDWQGDFGTTVDREQTDIHSAIKLAGAIMPSEGSRRIVVVSDGAETIGRAAESATWLTEQGIGIDAVVVSDDRLNDVAIEKVDLPARARPSSPFDIRVVIRFASSQPNETTCWCSKCVKLVSPFRAWRSVMMPIKIYLLRWPVPAVDSFTR